jgi:hypothetical protein
MEPVPTPAGLPFSLFRLVIPAGPWGASQKNAGTMSTNRIFTIVMPGKIMA